MTPAELSEVLACCDALDAMEKAGTAIFPWKPDEYPDLFVVSDDRLACAARNTLRASVGCVRALVEMSELTYSFDSRRKMEALRDAALRAFLADCRAAGVGRVE